MSRSSKEFYALVAFLSRLYQKMAKVTNAIINKEAPMADGRSRRKNLSLSKSLQLDAPTVYFTPATSQPRECPVGIALLPVLQHLR